MRPADRGHILKKMDQKEFDIDYDKGLVETGDPGALIRLFERARAGESITVGFLGGSITQGCHATDDKLSYAYLVYEWFVRTFPEVVVTYVNAGIGATDSEYAAARLAEDLLSAKPDFVLMEFAVNEGANAHYLETYEGCIRQILSSKPGVALITMNNVFYNEGSSAERIHREASRHYDLPSLSMRTTIYDAILSGKIVKEDITSDDLHPNDTGHRLVARVITNYLDSLNKSKAASEAVCAKSLPAPLTQNRYERITKYDNRNSAAVLKSVRGFVPDNKLRTEIKDCFRYGYSADEEGSFAEYEVSGSCIAVLYTRTIRKPAPVARVTIDGNEEQNIILDANFEETWGDKLELTDIYMSNSPAVHTVRVEIIETHPDDVGAFYLAGIIVSE